MPHAVRAAVAFVALCLALGLALRAAAEALATQLWPDAVHAVVALPDARKGERLVLLTTRPGADAPALLAHARAQGVAELLVPREVRAVGTVPLLGTGKVDYPAAQRLAADLAAGREAA